MTKRFTSFTLAAALSVLPAVAFATTLTGRVTNFSPTSISVFDKEVVIVGLNGETVFTTEAVRHRAEAAVLRAVPNASESKRPGSPGTAVHCERIANRLEKAAGVTAAAPTANLGTPAPVLQTSANNILSGKEVRELIANAKTPADHRKLAKHFAAVATRYEAEATDHAAEAKAYRATPNASETKRPGGPDTALHCDRLAEAARNAATAARDLARDHEQMAK